MTSKMTPWIWIDQRVVLALHDEQIAEHGGQSGIRNKGLLEAALLRSVNQANYEKSDVHTLAAAYGFGLARNHPFLDGNKRIALVVTELFLALNGFDLQADDISCLTTFIALADGSLPEKGLAAWLAKNTISAPK